ncbi:hypothetical protein PSHT_03007 [Puccinia striiformis]|nr:hypothetical protein PSHT_03007 [Puccinia striiformis]
MGRALNVRRVHVQLQTWSSAPGFRPGQSKPFEAGGNAADSGDKCFPLQVTMDGANDLVQKAIDFEKPALASHFSGQEQVTVAPTK